MGTPVALRHAPRWFLLAACFALTGCYLTKVATVPMRVVGAVASVVPFVGNSTHDAVDAVANTIDGIFY